MAAHTPSMAGMTLPAAALPRALLIGLIAFLTVVDLFATQAILPSLVLRYQVSPAAMGLAVNAGTLGMALAGLAVALLGRDLDRRRGIVSSLALLAVPTALLAIAPGLVTFTALRILQGLLMATAFTLTLAYLAERCDPAAAAAASAAYVTGNVASNLIGRLLAAAVTDHLGLAANFLAFALLNLLGAFLVQRSFAMARPMVPTAEPAHAAVGHHLRRPELRAGFAIGFLILFAFIGTFTFVNFVLVRPPLSLGMMQVGFVYLVFLPSILTTPLAGRVAQQLGTRPTLVLALALALAGLPLLVLPSLACVLTGLALVGIGTFFAQATATGFVGRSAMSGRAAASGLYLAAYFLGGLVGTAVLGQVFDHLGWPACVTGVGLALLLAAWLARGLGDAPVRATAG